MTSVEYIVGAVVCLAAGAGIGSMLAIRRHRKAREAESLASASILDAARREAESITAKSQLAAAEESARLRKQLEDSVSARRDELSGQERRLNEREALLNTQLTRVMEMEKELKLQGDLIEKKASALGNAQRELVELTRRRREELQEISHLTAAEARASFLKEIEQESLKDAADLSRKIVEDARTRAEEKARNVIAAAIQRYAAEHTAENTSATLAITGDDIKGRIIGREGRNIRAFENATGVTVLIDDTPGAVVLSGFDPVRREIAREAMARLIQDGRIHPTRIEEVVDKVKSEMDETVVRLGEEAVARTGIAPMHPEIVKLLGKLHFRKSFSQNLLDHSVEVAQLCGLMAAELGLDVSLAKRSGLLHDIGKAVSHEVEGPHAVVGSEMIKRCGECDEVVNGVGSHHNDVPPVGPWGILVSAADAISAARPGARSETMATYIRRVEDLEKIGLSFQGVEKCFAVQAGRELRVFVQPERVTDEQAFGLARSIASKIENELQYPGQIRVTVIRETRCVELAK
ncbi:MAG TPA: ribonuclease Y [Verrucomicrobiota bacterium]|nr:ribonuclease Y [Verrucomicrobiota bacterium]